MAPVARLKLTYAEYEQLSSVALGFVKFETRPHGATASMPEFRTDQLCSEDTMLVANPQAGIWGAEVPMSPVTVADTQVGWYLTWNGLRIALYDNGNIDGTWTQDGLRPGHMIDPHSAFFEDVKTVAEAMEEAIKMDTNSGGMKRPPIKKIKRPSLYELEQRAEAKAKREEAEKAAEETAEKAAGKPAAPRKIAKKGAGKAKRVLKVQKGTTPVTPAKKPTCEIHGHDLVFQSDVGVWQCPDDQCPITKKPEVGGDDTVTKVTGTPKVVAHRDEDGDYLYYLFYEASNIMVELPREAVMGHDIYARTFPASMTMTVRSESFTFFDKDGKPIPTGEIESR